MALQGAARKAGKVNMGILSFCREKEGLGNQPMRWDRRVLKRRWQKQIGIEKDEGKLKSEGRVHKEEPDMVRNIVETKNRDILMSSLRFTQHLLQCQVFSHNFLTWFSHQPFRWHYQLHATELNQTRKIWDKYVPNAGPEPRSGLSTPGSLGASPTTTQGTNGRFGVWIQIFCFQQ